MTSTPPPDGRSTYRGRWHIWRERRGNLALLTALMMPVFLGATGLGVEASNWSVLQTELQRTADVAAVGAALAYEASTNVSTAVNAGADIAELNGLTGATQRNWSAATNTLTDDLITAQLVSGIRNASDNAFQVSVQQVVPLTFAHLFVTPLTYTISAQATAELIGSGTAQPCILGLGGYKTHTTTGTDVSMSGSASIVGTNCSVRSDAGITMSGSASITAASVYAGGSIGTSGTATIHAPEHPNDGQISDPYAGNTAIQNAFNALAACPSCVNESVSGSSTKTLAAGDYGTVTVSGSATMNIGPGSYSSISLSGVGSTLNMSPGLYLVDGGFSVSGSNTVNASGGVTIVTAGAVSISGSSTTNLTAPGTSPVANAIPGVVIASKSTSASGISGSSGMVVTGVLYLPNAALTFSGSSGNQSSPCLEVIANSVTMSGSSNLGGYCSSYGALSFGSTNATTTALVQ